MDAVGDLFIADSQNDRVREVNTSGIITTVAGNGVFGFSGDNGPATAAELDSLASIDLDAKGDLFIVDEGNQRIREVNTSGVISTVAGNGTAGYNGDHIPATRAELDDPAMIAVDANGNLFIADAGNNRIREVSTSGVITTVAGNGVKGTTGDNGAATAAELNVPYGVAVDAEDNIFIAGANRIREVDLLTGVITTVAGNGTAGFSGDNGPATSAELNLPYGIVVDAATGGIFIADTQNERIREFAGGNYALL